MGGKKSALSDATLNMAVIAARNVFINATLITRQDQQHKTTRMNTK